jgi:hypothetical protein
MLIEDIKNIRSARKDLRNFGLTVGIALAGLAALLWWWNKPAWVYFGAVGVALVLCGLVLPSVLRPLQRAWMTLAVVLGWVMTRVLLSLMFFLVFTTVGLIARALGKQFLALKWKRPVDSYWNYREPQPHDKSRMEMQF